MRFFISSTLLLITLMLPLDALANDASFYGHGATVFAFKEHRVRMVSENIRIRYKPSKSSPRREWMADCTFEFENLSDKEIQIQMGFPDWRKHGEDAGGQVFAIKDFETLIKNKVITTVHKKVSDIKAKARASGDLSPLKIPYPAAYTWAVAFGPKERIIVKNRYRFGGGNTNGPIGLCLDAGKVDNSSGLFWHRVPRKTGFGSGVCYEARYIVTTGNTWATSIGEATIEIDLPPDAALNHVIPYPKAHRVSPKTVFWHFKDFKPTQELRVVFATSFPDGPDNDGLVLDFSSIDQVNQWLLFARANGFTRDAISVMRDVQAYSFGLRDTGQSTPVVFGKWFKPLSKVGKTRAQLTPIEKQILAALDAASKIPPK
jgi:hypothetical protein